MLKSILSVFSILILLLSAGANSVTATSNITPPDFPTCSAPTGTLKVSYESGVHGIPGQGEVTGSDSVYLLENSNVLQCFCAPDTQGIQTNWWKIGSLSAKQIITLKKLGWIYIPSGSVWGLDNTAYMAQNLSFSCASQGGGGSSSGGTGGAGSAPVCDSAQPKAPKLLSVFRKGSSATLVWTKEELATHYTIYYGTDPDNFTHSVVNTGNVTSFTINELDPNASYAFSVRAVNNCMPSDPSGDPQVLGASTNVLGLAATGTLPQIILYSAIGFVSMLVFLLSRKYRAAK